MKTNHFLLTSILLLFSTGCTKEALAPEIDPSALELRAKEYVTVPMKMWIEALTDFSLGGIACLPENSGVYMPAGGWMQGHATHMGQLQMPESPWAHGSCELVFDENGNLTMIAISGSHGHWTGANGDRLYWEGRYESYLDGTFFADLDIVSGTGKFADATGNVKGLGYVDPETGYAVGAPEGHLKILK